MIDPEKPLLDDRLDRLREEILHDSEMDNDTINYVLGIIDTHIENAKGPQFSHAEKNAVVREWSHLLDLIFSTGDRVFSSGYMERIGGDEDAPEQILAALEEMARKYRELVPKEPVDAEGATVDNGWFPMPPNDGSVHMRGLEVHDNATGHRHWEQYRGYIHEESGDFISEDDEDFGWRPDDYTHWKPLSPPPAAPGDKGE